MKNLNVFLTALLLSVSFIFTNCDKNNVDLQSTEEVLIRHSWSVDYFFKAQDMTGDFANSNILFSSTGAVGYQKNGVTTAGTWSRTVDGSNAEFVSMQFNTSDPNITKLNKTWKLTDRQDNSFQFEGNDGVDYTLFRIKTQ